MPKFDAWLMDELNQRRWTRRELARRADVSESMVYSVVGGQRNPGFDFCVGIARALDLRPEVVLRRAGLLPEELPEVEEEAGLLLGFRLLSRQARQAVIDLVRSLAREPQVLAEEPAPYEVPRTATERLALALARDLERLTPEDQTRVFDLMRRLRGPALGGDEQAALE